MRDLSSILGRGHGKNHIKDAMIETQEKLWRDTIQFTIPPKFIKDFQDVKRDVPDPYIGRFEHLIASFEAMGKRLEALEARLPKGG